MTKITLKELALRLKKISKTAKRYTEDRIKASEVHLIEAGTPTSGYLKTYILAIGVSTENEVVATGTGKNLIGKIDIPKDFLVTGVKRCTVVEGEGADTGRFFVTHENGNAVTTYEAPAGVNAAGLWAIFTVNVKSGTATNEYLSVNLTELIDIYTSGNRAISVSNNQISLVLGTNTNGLTITSGGLELTLATNAAAGAQSAAGKQQEEHIASDLNVVTDGEILSWFGYNPANMTVADTAEKALKDAFDASGFDDSLTDA